VATNDTSKRDTRKEKVKMAGKKSLLRNYPSESWLDTMQARARGGKRDGQRVKAGQTESSHDQKYCPLVSTNRLGTLCRGEEPLKKT